MRSALAIALLALLAPACGGAEPSPDPTPPSLADAAWERHEDEVGAFQGAQLRAAHGDPGGADCMSLCLHHHGACQAAAELCSEELGSARCADARRGCDWTATLLPRACRACAGWTR